MLSNEQKAHDIAIAMTIVQLEKSGKNCDGCDEALGYYNGNYSKIIELLNSHNEKAD